MWKEFFSLTGALVTLQASTYEMYSVFVREQPDLRMAPWEVTLHPDGRYGFEGGGSHLRALITSVASTSSTSDVTAAATLSGVNCWNGKYYRFT